MTGRICLGSKQTVHAGRPQSQGGAQRTEEARQLPSKICGGFEEDEEERLKAILQEIEARRHHMTISADPRRTLSLPVRVEGHISSSRGETPAVDTDAWVDCKPFKRCTSLDAAH